LFGFFLWQYWDFNSEPKTFWESASTIWTTSATFFALVIFHIGFHIFLPRTSFRLWSSYLFFPWNWNYWCGPPHLAFKMGDFTNFFPPSWAGFEPQFLSSLPKKLELQAWATMLGPKFWFLKHLCFPLIAHLMLLPVSIMDSLIHCAILAFVFTLWTSDLLGLLFAIL
jgi:hypothetical protein